jgi:hypothetical protein
MSRRRWEFLACLVLAAFGTAAAAGAARPVKIDKIRSEHKVLNFASDLCAVGVVKEGAIYETEGCHRGTPLGVLLKFQVVAPRPASVKIAGTINAVSCKRCEIDMKVVLLIDGKRIRTAEIPVRGGKPADYAAQRLTRLSKGKHMVELGIQAVEEEGLSGLTVNSWELSAKTS